MTPPTADQETDAGTRLRIVTAAQERFMAFGFSVVTMDEIARDLGMSKKTLYQFFPGKLDLLAATSRRNSDACEKELDAIAAENLGFFDRARKTFEHIARIYSRLSPAYMTDVRRSAPRVWSEIQKFRRERIGRHMHALLEQGVKQGVLREDLDRETLVRLYLTMTSALLNPELSGWAQGEPIAPIFETFVRVYFEGLITPAGRKKAAR
jgi:AcrR family transcriptional regulator